MFFSVAGCYHFNCLILFRFRSFVNLVDFPFFSCYSFLLFFFLYLFFKLCICILVDFFSCLFPVLIVLSVYFFLI